LAFSAHTTADHLARPSGTQTTSPGFSSMPRGTAIGIVLIERDRHQHIDDARR
jgi:hypothetical protein